MNKRSFIVLVFILVLIGGGCFVYLSLGANNINFDNSVAEETGKVEEGVEQSEKTVSPAEETKVDNQDSKTEKTESKKKSKKEEKDSDKKEKKTEVSSDKNSETKTEKLTEQKTEAKPEKKPEMPTQAPTEQKTEAPTQQRTEEPTERKTETPTQAPTEQKTEAPTQQRTEAPTERKTETPTQAPSEAPKCSHNWVWKTHTETVHHDAVTHTQYYYSDAWDEAVYVTKCKCLVCGTLYNDASEYYNNDTCYGSSSDVQVVDHYIHHDPQVIDSEEIVDQPAYDEYVEVKDYQYCSKCGETK